MSEASKRTGYTYRFGEGVRSPEQQAQKVSSGVSWTYNSRHLSGRARDVLAFDPQGNYIRDANHPAYKALGDVYNEMSGSSPVPVKWGVVRDGAQVDPGHFELAGDAPATPQLNLDGILEPHTQLNLDGIVETPDDEVVSTDAAYFALPSSLSPLPQRPTFDVQAMEGRQERDAYRATERDPHARLEVSVPLLGDDPSRESSDALMRRAITSWAQSKGIPPEFAKAWMERNAPEGYAMHGSSGAELQSAADAMTPDSYDEASHSLRVRLPASHLRALEDDYKLSQLRSVPGLEDAKSLDEVSPSLRALTVDSDETSPGEKFLDVATPIASNTARAVGRVGDLATRPLQSIDAAFWAKARGASTLDSLKTDYQQFFGDQPELGKNVIAEGLRNSERLRAVNPRLPALLGELSDIILEPSNLVLLGGAGKAAKLIGRSARVGEMADAVGDAARSVGLMDRGFVEARPLGLMAEPKAGLASLGELSPELREMAAASPEEASALREGVTPPANAEDLEYAKGRQRFYTEQAEQATDPKAKAAAQANADAYADDVARMEGRELHHSELQPRDELGKFDGPPRSLPSRVMNTVSDVVNAPKSIKSSFALHGPFRQGVFQAAAHPTFLKDAIVNQVKAFASEDAFQDFARSVIERPDFGQMNEAGLFLPSVYDAEGVSGTGALMREERFASKVAERIPGVRASGRAYNAAMDSLRLQAWDSYMADLTADGAQPSKQTLSALADWVNVSTGRGRVPILDRDDWGRRVVAAMNNPFWSPRAMASRFNVLSPYQLVMNASNPATRPVAWLQVRDSMRALTTVGTTLGLLSLVPGVTVGLNPYKRNWGKVSIGDTHFDVLDGVPSTARFAAQMSRSFYRKAKGEPVNPKNEPAALTKDFLRRRLSPSGQVVADVVTGKTLEGEKPTVTGEAADLLVPFVVEDVYKGWLDAGGSSVGDAMSGKEFKTGFRGAVKGLPSAVGVPSATYKRGDSLNLDGILEQ